MPPVQGEESEMIVNFVGSLLRFLLIIDMIVITPIFIAVYFIMVYYIALTLHSASMFVLAEFAAGVRMMT